MRRASEDGLPACSGQGSRRGLNLRETDPIWRERFNAHALQGGTVFLRLLVIVAWLAVAFVLPPALGRGSIAPDVDVQSAAAGTVAVRYVPEQPPLVRLRK